jgi:TfoX/Sxy family transcriptional regulator of competence genes
MPYSESLAERIRQVLGRRRGLQEREMFGEIGFLLKGNMYVGVWKDSLIARIGPAHYSAALGQPHVAQFDITGRPMNGWVLIGPEGIDDEPALRRWIYQAVEFVSTLPAK